MKREEYFLDFQKLEELVGDEICWFNERDKAAFKYEYFKQTYFNKPPKQYHYPVMLCLGMKKFNLKYELEDILQQIKSGSTKDETQYFRNHFKEYDTNLLHNQFLNHFKSFTPCGIFYNRKTRIEIRKLNGIIMLQNNSEDLTDEHYNQIKNDKFTYVLFKLLQPNRFAILVKTNGMTSKNYMHVESYIQNYYRNLLQENILNQTQINTVVYVSHDEKLHHNKDSSILSIKMKH